ncbi:MAG: CpaD family pilus assembly lipoprotein [Pseudomonadota bacterium]
MTAQNTPLFALRRPSAPLLSAAVLALGLSACSSVTTPLRADLQHPITAEPAEAILEIGPEGGLSSYDARQLDAFARGYLKAGEGDLTLAQPIDESGARVAAEAALRLQKAGVPADQILRGRYEAGEGGYTGVVASYFSTMAVTEPCPTDPSDPNIDPSNGVYLSFGCAHQQNLAAMLEDPRDAERARAATPPSADRRRAVLLQYAAGQDTAAEGQETTDTTE